MTGENARRNAADEMQRAATCLEEARALQTGGFPYGAVSRACYAVFHAARALLFLIGIEAHTHKALVSLIGEHYVRSGRLQTAMGRLVSRLQRDREDADYEAGAVFTTEEASRIPSEAEAFLNAARALIDAG